jgi:hypothetical protein
MPWESGFVPPDGYRHYYRGFNEKMEFDPCGHVLEDYYDADAKHHSNDWAFEQMDKIRKQQEKTVLWARTHCTWPEERNLMNGVQCPYCDVKSEAVRYSVNQDFDEMPESKFKAYRIMGWV